MVSLKMSAVSAHRNETRLRFRLLTALVAVPSLWGTVGAGAGTVPAAPADSRAPAASVRHAMTVSIDPDAHRVTVTDTLTFGPDIPPGPDGKRRFLLHAGLTPVCTTKGAVLTRRSGTPAASDFGLPEGQLDLPDRVPVEEYELQLPPTAREATLSYGGAIEHAPEAPVTESARSFSDTPGTVGSEGVFLSTGVRWYPWFGDGLVSCAMDVSLPIGWDAVAQGTRTRHDVLTDHLDYRSVGPAAGHVRWEEDHPQDGITLAAARFTQYTRPAGGHVMAMVFLRTPDAALANRYLDATVKYLDTYSKMLGPYPYTKFALVENFWESGLGLPSYTLLGPTVLRLPFIIDTSYPHEILHSWWGNSVFVDEASGNWCEGLTAYQADYRLKEEKGEGAGYRRDALQKYADFVSQSKDFPLTGFRERESPATEAVGYGKAMMLFHMLRRGYGDEAFLMSLRRFYEKNRFRKASWGDLAAAFPEGATPGATSSVRLSAKEMIDAWTTRAGAPRFCVGGVVARPAGGAEPGWRVEGTITQIQPEAPWKIDVPVAIEMEDPKAARTDSVHFDGTRRSAWFELALPRRPNRVAVDPDFDLFRRIEREEVPAALSLAFGADTALAVLPSAESAGMQTAYRAVADGWARGKESTFKIVLDSEIDALPEDRTVWVFGWENRFRDRVAAAVARYGADLSAGALRIGGEAVPHSPYSAALVTTQPGHPDLALGWVASDTAAALPGLGRKLPHYAKYSYLRFEGDEPTNTLKGSWPVVDTPLTVGLGPDDLPFRADRPCAVALPAAVSTGASPAHGAAVPAAADTVPAPAALIQPEWISSDRMMEMVRALSAPELAGRGFGSKGLDAAADRIAAAFQEAGLAAGGDSAGSWFQGWKATGGDPAHESELRNVVGILRGSGTGPDAPLVVIGAHYDHLGRGWPDAKAGNAGRIHPGADDNASGVAVLLELARAMARERALQARSGKEASAPAARTVVFVAFSGEEAGLLGSRRFLEASAYAPSRLAAMINLDTVGRLGAGRLLVLGSGSASGWDRLLRGVRERTHAPVEIVPGDPGGSDQKSFLDAGVPAVQLFTGANTDYHTPGDTADRIDARGLTTVTVFTWVLAETLSQPGTVLLAAPGSASAGPHGGSEPGSAPASGATASPSSARRVTLGTVPDFAYEGMGVRLSGVVPGSPAEKAGLAAGDILVKLGETSIPDLRAFSDALKTLSPGDKVHVVFTRDGKERSIQTEVVGR